MQHYYAVSKFLLTTCYLYRLFPTTAHPLVVFTAPLSIAKLANDSRKWQSVFWRRTQMLRVPVCDKMHQKIADERRTNELIATVRA